MDGRILHRTGIKKGGVNTGSSANKPAVEPKGQAGHLVGRLVDAITPILTEAADRADYHNDTWNPDAHLDLTITIQECRDLADAVAKAKGVADKEAKP